MKLIAVDSEGKQLLRFKDSTEAGIWAKLPTQDIEQAQKKRERLYGILYIEDTGDSDHVPTWEMETFGMNERKSDALMALKLVTAIDNEGFAYDPNTSNMLTPDQIFEQYWQPCTVRELYEALMASVNKKHFVLDRMDEEKQEIQKLIVSQKETNSRGDKCLYVPIADAPEVLKHLCEEMGLEGKLEGEWEEGYFGKHNGVCYFVVNEVVKPFSIEEWRYGQKANKSK
jgi:hypothetical protein